MLLKNTSEVRMARSGVANHDDKLFAPIPNNRDIHDSDDSGHGIGGKSNKEDENIENKLKLLEPRGSDKIELFDYLTNTMSLEIVN